jgi:hypothetical protein
MNRVLIGSLSVLAGGIVVLAGQTPAPAARAFWRWRNLGLKELPR